MTQFEDGWATFGPEFRFLRADAFLRAPDLVPESDGGIYAVLLRGAGALLTATGYFDLGGTPPVTIDGFLHVYTGSSYTLQKRLKSHLDGEVRTSTLRKTLLAIDLFCGQRGCEIIGCRDAWDEETLSAWLVANALVAICSTAAPLSLEKDFLSRTPSPLNITNRRASAYARRLIAIRSQFEGRPIPQCCAEFAPNHIFL